MKNTKRELEELVKTLKKQLEQAQTKLEKIDKKKNLKPYVVAVKYYIPVLAESVRKAEEIIKDLNPECMTDNHWSAGDIRLGTTNECFVEYEAKDLGHLREKIKDWDVFEVEDPNDCNNYIQDYFLDREK